MKIHIKTFGCQANYADSEVLSGVLAKEHTLTTLEKAELVIVNSCSVKNTTQNRILSFIEKNKNKNMIIGGCLTSTLKFNQPNIKATFDTNSILKVPEIIKTNKSLKSDKKESRINLSKIRKNKDTAIITIAQGCIQNCSYCSTKLARGSLKSYKEEEIIKEFKEAIKEGCKKIYLTSQDNSCYGFDINTNLVSLLNNLLKIKGNYEIRIGMMNPGHLNFLDDLIKIYKNKKIIKFIHIPVQSGSNKILKEMDRNYNIEDFKKIVEKLRKEIKDINISTDIITGYPTETEEDFNKTLILIKEIKPEVLNISRFSPRPKTKAAKLKQLPSEIIKERSRKLTKLFNQMI